MALSIQLPSQRQVGTTHTILQVGPFLPTYRTMRIVWNATHAVGNASGVPKFRGAVERRGAYLQ
jgi:hypothetical protein